MEKNSKIYKLTKNVKYSLAVVGISTALGLALVVDIDNLLHPESEQQNQNVNEQVFPYLEKNNVPLPVVQSDGIPLNKPSEPDILKMTPDEYFEYIAIPMDEEYYGAGTSGNISEEKKEYLLAINPSADYFWIWQGGNNYVLFNASKMNEETCQEIIQDLKLRGVVPEDATFTIECNDVDKANVTEDDYKGKTFVNLK